MLEILILGALGVVILLMLTAFLVFFTAGLVRLLGRMFAFMFQWGKSDADP